MGVVTAAKHLQYAREMCGTETHVFHDSPLRQIRMVHKGTAD
jgi:hypothetical protein